MSHLQAGTGQLCYANVTPPGWYGAVVFYANVTPGRTCGCRRAGRSRSSGPPFCPSCGLSVEGVYSVIEGV
eukprot:6527757-Pyramimonas_sp.AAC.1